MPDEDSDLTPVRAEDLRACIAYAQTSDSRLAKPQSAELMASIVAERLIARLERDGFVVMPRPPASVVVRNRHSFAIALMRHGVRRSPKPITLGPPGIIAPSRGRRARPPAPPRT